MPHFKNIGTTSSNVSMKHKKHFRNEWSRNKQKKTIKNFLKNTGLKKNWKRSKTTIHITTKTMSLNKNKKMKWINILKMKESDNSINMAKIWSLLSITNELLEISMLRSKRYLMLRSKLWCVESLVITKSHLIILD